MCLYSYFWFNAQVQVFRSIVVVHIRVAIMAAFHTQLDSTSQAPGIKFDGRMGLPMDSKISYELKPVSPMFFMVH